MTTGLIICGALAHEVLDIVQRRGWDAELAAVPASVHVHPEQIGPQVEKRIMQLRKQYERLIVVFGDCGSRGALDEVLTRHNIPRLDGPHCFQWYGAAQFDRMMDEEPGTFFLTDFMVRTFRGMIVKGMGLDQYPQLIEDYFANYQRVVYLVQKPDPKLMERAKAAANYLGLPLEIRATGYGWLESQLATLMENLDASVTA